MSAQENSTETPPKPDYPFASFTPAATVLRRPFTSDAIKFKVQATWPKNEPKNGLIVGYIDARLAIERLNLVVPGIWGEAFEPVDQRHLLCRLTVGDVTRCDVGEGAGKTLYSDAFKRAAVKFGVGVSIYAIPKMILKLGTGQLKEAVSEKGKTLAMTSDGEKTVRDLYSKWLEDTGVKAFGEPLDHGDVPNAQGDYEADAEPEVSTPSSERLLTAAECERIRTQVGDEKRLGFLLAAIGAESLESMTTAKAFELRAEMDK